MRRLRPFLRFPSSMFCRTLHNHSSTLDCPNNPDLDGVGVMTSLLSSRAVIRFRGNETLKFLHGLLTNDIRRFGDQFTSSPPMYASLLTPHGKFLYDMFVYKPNGSDQTGPFELFMDVDNSMADEFLETLMKYRLKSKVEIDNMDGEFSCWQCYGGVYNLYEADESARWKWFRDPRLVCLGSRGIFPRETTPPLVEACKVVDEENFLLWRVKHGVAEGSSEIPKGEAFPLEYNFAALNAISFDKGCYVGQEVVARTHHRGVVRKRLFPLKFLDGKGKEVEEESVAAGMEVINMVSGKKAGTICAVFGCCGLGVLRLDDVLNGGETLSIQGKEEVKVMAINPNWWPPQWFQEHLVDCSLK